MGDVTSAGPSAKAPGGAGLGGQAAEGAPLCQPEP